jgi:hypothetical protein
MGEKDNRLDVLKIAIEIKITILILNSKKLLSSIKFSLDHKPSNH